MNDAIICPWCDMTYDGYANETDYKNGELIFCDACDKGFYVYIEKEITFDSEKAFYGTCDKCNADDVLIEDTCSFPNNLLLCLECAKKE